MNDMYWGAVGEEATIVTPGENTGIGFCSAREWGLATKNVVVYGSIGDLRAWAQSALDKLPPERGEAPLVTVDSARQQQWLRESGVLGATDDHAISRTVTAETVRALTLAIAADPAAAGWTLGDDVAELWAGSAYSPGDLVAGVKLAGTGHKVGIGEPLTDWDFTVQTPTNTVELASACLIVVADRINQSY